MILVELSTWGGYPHAKVTLHLTVHATKVCYNPSNIVLVYVNVCDCLHYKVLYLNI